MKTKQQLIELTRYQLSVLKAVPETEPIHWRTIAERTGVGESTLKWALWRLESSGLVAAVQTLGVCGVQRTAEGTAALERHVKRERQGDLYEPKGE